MVGLGPALTTTVGPIARWAARAWRADATCREPMQRVWKAQIARLGDTADNAAWQQVGDACSALIAALGRIVWTNRGRVVDLRRRPPRRVRMLAEQSVED